MEGIGRCERDWVALEINELLVVASSAAARSDRLLAGLGAFSKRFALQTGMTGLMRCLAGSVSVSPSRCNHNNNGGLTRLRLRFDRGDR